MVVNAVADTGCCSPQAGASDSVSGCSLVCSSDKRYLDHPVFYGDEAGSALLTKNSVWVVNNNHFCSHIDCHLAAISLRATLRRLMMKKILLASAIVTMAFSSASMAAGDAAAGQAKSGICTACHNADGNSMVPMYPKLAGQHATYLENALKAYRDGQRTGGNAAIMAPMAKGLSDQDIANLAAYYSQQKAK
nr:cytochrome c [Thalassolituus sp. UBA2009]